ncbi:MAG: ATP-dependent protease subunit HslV [Planctomycetota bacterium]|nr:ATP-dependent protease subunit HslV [Planctomycetota bacterium]
MDVFRATTIVSARKDGKVALGGDGQVTVGNTIMKSSACKIRSLNKGQVLCGFAGSAADALALVDRFEAKLADAQNHVLKAAVALAKEWRTDRAMRRLEALMAIVDKNHSLILSGTGDIIEPEDGIIAIGSGGPMACAAAKALLKHAPQLSASDIVEEALKVTAGICIYTNDHISVKEVDCK